MVIKLVKMWEMISFLRFLFKKAAKSITLDRKISKLFTPVMQKKRVPIRVIRPYDMEVDRQRKLKAEQEENSLPHPEEDYNG